MVDLGGEIELFVLLSRSLYCRFLIYISILSPLAEVRECRPHIHKKMQYKKETQDFDSSSTKTNTRSLNPKGGVGT
jgi:hypothetical protein